MKWNQEQTMRELEFSHIPRIQMPNVGAVLLFRIHITWNRYDRKIFSSRRCQRARVHKNATTPFVFIILPMCICILICIYSCICIYDCTRGLGALRASNSSWWPFEPLDFIPSPLWLRMTHSPPSIWWTMAEHLTRWLAHLMGVLARFMGWKTSPNNRRTGQFQE